MAVRIPPPPQLARTDPAINRWLIEVASILSAAGGVDQNQVIGLPELVQQVDTLNTQIGDLRNTVQGQQVQITAIGNQLVTIANQISDLQNDVAALQARGEVLNGTIAPVVGLGKNGDWYSDTVAKHISVKVAGAWVQIV